MKRVLTLAALAMLLAVPVGCTAHRALLVTQYPAGASRVEDIQKAIVNRFDADNMSYRLTIFGMDTIGHPTETWRTQMTDMAMMRVETYNPDVVFLAGDDTASLLAEKLVNRAWRVIFLDVKADPAGYLLAAKLNVTGVHNPAPVAESFALIRKLLPSARRVAVIADESPEGNAVVKQVASASSSELKVVAVKQASVRADWLAAIESVQDRADVLIVGAYRHVRAEQYAPDNLPAEEVLRLTAKANSLPDFAFDKDATAPGCLMAAVTAPLAAQADLAAEMALRMLLYGADISSVRPNETRMRRTIVNLNRANEFNIAVPAYLLDPGPEVKLRKRNLWERFLGLFRRERRPQELDSGGSAEEGAAD